MATNNAAFLELLREQAQAQKPLDASGALRILEDRALPTVQLLGIASIPRQQRFGRKVQVHILNNVRNGYCPEDCGYCAQRKGGEAPIAAYGDKSDEEILEEARLAYENGAYRYCMVVSGRGPGSRQVQHFAGLIQKIKQRYPLSICLSAGILTDPELAVELKSAGLDRYNHNLNTSQRYYDTICSTHDYEDRRSTLQTMSAAGVQLCSGVIAGMGESAEDLVAVALELQSLGAPSIPVNFFLPTEGHAIEHPAALNAEDCLRILIMFRLTNPAAEIRMAAGRERYLGDRQSEALQIANSLFVSGYLNVQGDNAAATFAMIQAAGYEPEFPEGRPPLSFSQQEPPESAGDSLALKDIAALRPARRSAP
ncbi:MAG: biotin synthase BioB [Leptospirales bacterium]|nr:biotin synthase BioB [Leptospirales bacterium]